jgi:hypothetical protein
LKWVDIGKNLRFHADFRSEKCTQKDSPEIGFPRDLGFF